MKKMTKEELIKLLEQLPSGAQIIACEYQTAPIYEITHIEKSSSDDVFELRIKKNKLYYALVKAELLHSIKGGEK